MIESPADGGFRQVLERETPIAVPCQLGIEGNGTETGNSQAWGCAGGEERPDRVAVAAVVAAHILDIAEDAMRSLRQRVDGPGDHAP
jgi:hypothetical protein